MAELTRPTDVKKYVDLSQYSTISSSNILNHLPALVNQLLRAIGNNVVLRGMDCDISTTGTSVSANIASGVMIQDHTLIEIPHSTDVSIDNAGLYDPDGKFVVYVHFQFLNTVSDNPVRLGIKHISQTGMASGGWDHNVNATVLTFYDFTKDIGDNVTSIEESNDEFIVIEGIEYYKYGLSAQNISLLRYVQYFLENLDTGSPPPAGSIPNIINDDFTVVGDLEVQGQAAIHGPDVYIDHNLHVAEDLDIQGIFRTTGPTVYLQSDDVKVDANELEINANELATGITGRYAGFRVNRGTLPSALLLFDEDTDTWLIGIEGQELTPLSWDDAKPKTFKYSSNNPSVFHAVNHGMGTIDLQINVQVEDPLTGRWTNELVGLEYASDNRIELNLTESANVRVNITEVT